METGAVVVEDKLKSPQDGRKKAWWAKKIEQLEAELAAKGPKSYASTHEWADGFVACMHQFQLLSKSQRQQIHRQLLEHGPGYAKRIKGARFRGVVL